MSAFSPTARGFRLLFVRPEIPCAEVAWRWTFAVAAWFLCGGFLLEYASSLPVDMVDRLLLGTEQPALILEALHRIFHGSALRFVGSSLLLAAALTAAWICLASFGRAATAKAIVEEFGQTTATGANGSVLSLLALNFLRSAITLAAIVAGFGATVFAGGIWMSTHFSAGNAARFWLLFLFVIWFAWGILNWTLATAGLFAAARRDRGLVAVVATVRWWREHPGSIVAAGVWFGIAHGVALVIACLAGLGILAVSEYLGNMSTVLLEVLVAATYFAIADFLYIGRLAAYLSIERGEQTSELFLQREKPLLPPRDGATIDQSELILSDIPLPAT